jgi:hypothetical protein
LCGYKGTLRVPPSPGICLETTVRLAPMPKGIGRGAVPAAAAVTALLDHALAARKIHAHTA